jgi:hypothetical protein
MTLTALRIGNFKAFAAAQRVSLRPITLVYSANSAGKSSIVGVPPPQNGRVPGVTRPGAALRELPDVHQSASGPHPTYGNLVISDFIGISLPNGFDTTTAQTSVTRWTRLGRQDRDDIQREFDPASRRHALRHRFAIE